MRKKKYRVTLLKAGERFYSPVVKAENEAEAESIALTMAYAFLNKDQWIPALDFEEYVELLDIEELPNPSRSDLQSKSSGDIE